KTGKGNITEHVGPIWSLVVSKDGTRVTTLGQDNTLREWTVRTAAERRRLSLPVAATFGRLLTADRAVLGTKDGSLYVWDARSKKVPVKLRGDHPDGYQTLCRVSSHGRSILAMEYNPFTLGRNVTCYHVKNGVVGSTPDSAWIREIGDLGSYE